MTLYESGVRQIIDDYLIEESKKIRDYNGYWSASSAGYCMRKNMFEMLGVPPVKEDARKQRVFTAGHLFHDWIQKLTKDAGCSIAQELELQDEELKIRGHFDDLILTGDKIILYDYKTANSRSFDYKKELSHFHRMQLGTYMYMLRTGDYGWGGNKAYKHSKPLNVYTDENLKMHLLKDLSEARILILEKDTLRTKEFQLFWTPELEKDVVGYWRTLNGYWKAKKLPKCTCADFEGGFMAKPQYNPYYYDGEPCSLKYLKEWKEKQNESKG